MSSDSSTVDWGLVTSVVRVVVNSVGVVSSEFSTVGCGSSKTSSMCSNEFSTVGGEW